ncbi:hypothetical protein QQM79_12275 [Marinobacteraceae bacterium S3BR75-40.1]
MTALLRAIRRHPWAFAMTFAGFLLGYHALLALLVTLRFEGLPNYFMHYDVTQNLALIMDGTESWRDRLKLFYQEPWLEFGYRNPDYYGIAEWSYIIMPSRLLLVTLTALALGLSTALWLDVRNQTGRRCLAVSSGGAIMLGLGSASLTWVVCCATPSWIVVLSMLGLGTQIALSLQPWGTALIVAGLVLQFFVVVYLARQVRQTTPPTLTESF